jgi:hypothetical protein
MFHRGAEGFFVSAVSSKRLVIVPLLALSHLSQKCLSRIPYVRGPCYLKLALDTPGALPPETPNRIDESK